MTNYPKRIGKGFIVYWDDKHKRAYVVDEAKGESNWSHVAEGITDDEGWVTKRDDDGDDVIYVNVLTKEMSFEKPLPKHAQEEESERSTPVHFNEKSWFDRFLEQTGCQKYAKLFIDEECVDMQTIKLFDDQSLKGLGVDVKELRVRILKFIDSHCNVVEDYDYSNGDIRKNNGPVNGSDMDLSDDESSYASSPREGEREKERNDFLQRERSRSPPRFRDDFSQRSRSPPRFRDDYLQRSRSRSPPRFRDDFSQRERSRSRSPPRFRDESNRTNDNCSTHAGLIRPGDWKCTFLRCTLIEK